MSERAKTAIVTGGASGVGLAVTESLLLEGWNVLIADLNEANGEAALASHDDEADERLAFLRVDVSDEQQVADSVELAVRHFGGVDAYVNNAGFPGAFGPVTDIDVEDWDLSFGVLVRGVFLGTKHAARSMIRAGEGGSIVNISSIAAFDGGTGPQAYSAAKAAVVSLTKSSAVELAPHGIRVNAIAPGHIISPMFMKGRDETVIDQVLRDQPWQVATTPADVAHAVLMLLDPRSSAVVGACLVVDGGLSAAGTQQNRALGIDPRALDSAGMNRGSTGVRSAPRRMVEQRNTGEEE